jgi:hypothetical protein
VSGDDEDLAELAVVEPTEFVAARNAKAKELRAAGERDRAGVVAKLRKPSWTAWALNVLARDEPEAIESFLAAGDALDEALSTAAGDRDAVREAQKADRAALNEAVDRAATVLTGAGRSLSDQDRQRITGTLRAAVRAAVTDAGVRDQLTRSVLVDDVEAPTFGFGFAAPDDADVITLDSARAKRAARGGSSKATTGPPRAEEERAAAEAEARRVEAARLAAERARLEDDLRTRREELDARTADAEAADAAVRAATAEAQAARAAVEDAAALAAAAEAALDALPDA